MDRELLNAFGLVAVALALGITVSANASGLASAGLLTINEARSDASAAATHTQTLPRRSATRAANTTPPERVLDNPRQTFQDLDANGNGYVTAGEAANHRVVMRQFAIADFNADRRLSIAEFNALLGLLEDEVAE